MVLFFSTIFGFLSKPSLLPPYLCSSAFVLGILSSTKPARRSCLPSCFLWAGDCWRVAPFIPSVRADTKNTSHTHIWLMLCYWSSGRVENRFNRAGLFLSLHRCVEKFSFGQVLCITLDLFKTFMRGLPCSINLVCACLWSSAPSSHALIWFWFAVLKMTSHPKQQNVLCRSWFSFRFCGSSIVKLVLAKPTVSPEKPALTAASQLSKDLFLNVPLR